MVGNPAYYGAGSIQNGGFNSSSATPYAIATLIPSASNINTGGVYQSSNLGSSVNPVFNGGTLIVSGAGTVTSAFTISSGGGKIDQNGVSSQFSGALTDSPGVAGRLIIINSGTALQGKVLLAGANTYSGGTEVQAGAILSIDSASALGTGGVDLVGSATVPAVLETTATMTVSAPITVAGDPVFSVAPGTTLTISSPITDGAFAGDVVVDGGGTLNLTAANTYTGPTTINTGSALMLSGHNASINSSSAVMNNGTFDLRNANPVMVSLGGSYTQDSIGTLRLAGAAPGTFQKLTVAGAATLGGTLDLTAATGKYAIGRYVLIDTAGGRSGTFSTFSNNLASVTSLGYLLGYDANQVYLDLTPTAGDTLQQIRQNATDLRAVINAQTAALQTALSYDCVVFDANNICVSTGGRYTSVGDGAVTNSGGLLVLGYRPTAKSRIGVFADQSLDMNGSNSISLGKNKPTFGLFGNWALNADGEGLNVHGSAVFSSSDLSIKRQASDTIEGGQGKTSLNGQAYEIRLNYVKPLGNATIVTPYIGLRYTRMAMGAYDEADGATTNWPVTYRRMVQKALSAVAGANLSWHVMDKLTASAGLGVQQNLHSRMGSYAGTSSIPGLANFDVPTAANTEMLAMASAGASYDLGQGKRFALSAHWQQQPSSSKGFTSLMATWSVGF